MTARELKSRWKQQHAVDFRGIARDRSRDEISSFIIDVVVKLSNSEQEFVG